jgi:phospholipase C
MENIEHIVVLMLENRTFDNMLGWLYEDEAPEHFIPATSGPPYRGLQTLKPGEFINSVRFPDSVFSVHPLRGARGFTSPNVAPGESFKQVTTQFYNTATPATDAPPTMTGVLLDFAQILMKRDFDEGKIRRHASMVMESFTPGQAPVLNQLARHYAVCDAWHASAPGQTNPNRAFLMCSTSNGMINNGDLETDPRAKEIEKKVGMAIGDDRVDAPTIFNALDTAKAEWRVFYETSYLPQKISTLLNDTATLAKFIPGVWEIAKALEPYKDYLVGLTSGTLESCYTWRLFPQIKDKIPGAHTRFSKTDEFHRLARAGQLPKFSYIEPFWTIAHSTVDNPNYQNLFSALGNDYHPPGSILAGEQFVKEIYSSLIANKAAWEKTLLLITFDEFVGGFDHAVADLKRGVVQPPWGKGPPPRPNPADFKFDRLGARVPTIVVSPWVEKGTVFRSSTPTPFDHTSVIATTLEQIGRQDLLAQFGERAKNAPSFNTVLTRGTPRTDPVLPFVDTQRKHGDPVLFGQTVFLKNENGQYLAPARCALKVSDFGNILPKGVMDVLVAFGLAAYFPTMGDTPAPMAFIPTTANPAPYILEDAKVLLVSRESGHGAHIILGAWPGSHDCYYYDEFLEGTELDNQSWSINWDDRARQLCYGDRIILHNQHYGGQRLSRDSRPGQSQWITTKHNGDHWTVEPGPVAV